MSFGELLLTLVVALIVLGPKRLPEVAYWLGRGMRWFNDIRHKLQTEFDAQVKLAELEHNKKRAEQADKMESKDD